MSPNSGISPKRTFNPRLLINSLSSYFLRNLDLFTIAHCKL